MQTSVHEDSKAAAIATGQPFPTVSASRNPFTAGVYVKFGMTEYSDRQLRLSSAHLCASYLDRSIGREEIVESGRQRDTPFRFVTLPGKWKWMDESTIVKMMKSSRDAFTQREEWTDAGLPFVELSGNHPLLISRPSQCTRGARMKEFRAFLFNFPFNSSFLT